jgi:hypothetical protein
MQILIYIIVYFPSKLYNEELILEVDPRQSLRLNGIRVDLIQFLEIFQAGLFEFLVFLNHLIKQER